MPERIYRLTHARRWRAPAPRRPAKRRLLLLLALLVSCSTPHPRQALANELPTDTNRIRSLTPQQAKELVTDFEGVRTEVEIKGVCRFTVAGALPLDGLMELDAETAKMLAAFKGQWMSVNGLTSLSIDTARAVAGFRGHALALNGLTTLDAGAAKALADFNGTILHLNGLKSLDVDTARALATSNARTLVLGGLTDISLDVATALAEFSGSSLHLGGVTRLDPAAAKALVGLRGSLLYLNGLTELSVETADVLADSPKWVGYLGITAFGTPDSVAVATVLAARKGPLSFPRLARISPKTLTALVEKEDVEIPLFDALELIPEPDGSHNDDFVIPDRFQRKRR